MKIQPKSKLVMIGDSITDCSRCRPVAEATGDALGFGYVGFINGFFNAVCPEHGIRIVNTGISGNTVRDLKSRWKTDVIDLSPDWLSVMIGINDVWRQFDARLLTETHVLLPEFKNTLDELITSIRPELKGLVLLTPFFIEPNKNDAFRVMSDQYGDAVRQLAIKHKAILVDTQAAFDEALKKVHPMTFSHDRVHPNHSGHILIARAFLKSVDFVF